MHIAVEIVISEHIIAIKLKIEQNEIIIKITLKIVIANSDIGICNPPNRGIPISNIKTIEINSHSKEVNILIIRLDK